MKKKQTAAFFDFDGTIYDGVISFDFLLFAFKNRLIKLFEIFSLSKFMYYYFLDKTNLAERYTINSKIYQSIKGWNSKELEEASEKFFLNNKGRNLYPEILSIIRWHEKKNHKVVIVTSALKEIVKPAKKYLKVDDILATEVKTKNDIYTGVILEIPIGDNRIKVIRKYCSKHNLDLNKSFAYSDHFSDIPMLESVGNAVVTKPDKRLRKYAIQKGWKIIDH